MKLSVVYACILLYASSAFATVVLRMPLYELAKNSDVIVYGVVTEVNDDTATSVDGPFRTEITFKIFRSIKGLKKVQGELRFTLPGGRAFDREMRIPGMPTFAKGDEVVMLLEATVNNRLTPTGLSQGVFYIDRARKVSRQLNGMTLYDQGDIKGDFLPAPITLDGLLNFLAEVH
jgi:hypothetical protein